jgi:hypothetical protein
MRPRENDRFSAVDYGTIEADVAVTPPPAQVEKDEDRVAVLS